MWAMLIIVIAAHAATSSVIYFPSKERCANAQHDLQIGLRSLPEGTVFNITCMPMDKVEEPT
jgi:hypothetical protein